MANIVEILLKAKDEISGVVGGIVDSLRGFEDKTKEVADASSLAFDEARYNFEQYGIAMGDMSTEYSGKFDEVTGKLIKFGDESVEVKDKSTGAFDEMKDKIKTSFTEINQAIEIGMKIAKTAKKVYDNTVGKALTVAGEIEELMRVSGDAPETLSALRIAAQEAGVGFDDLYKAMQNLNENGIAPTVDNLVAIADEYVNLQDPLEKAKLLTENFGEAGDEIAPMLEAIAGGVEEVQDAGLIFTEEEIQAAKDYEVALADLGLAFDSFKVKIGKAVFPALTEVFNNLAGDPTEMANLFDDLYAAADKALFAGSINADTWQLIIKDATTVTGSYSEQVEKLKFHLGILNDMNGDATNSTEELTVAEQAAADAALAAAEAQAKMIAEQEKLNTTLTSTVFTLGQKYTPILDDIADKQADIAELNQIIKNGGGVFDGVAISAADAQIKVNGLTDEINASIDAMKAMAAQAVAGIAWDQITADGKLTMDEITRYYDYLVNTGLMSAEAGQLATQNLINAWSEWDPEMKQLLLESLLDTTEVDDYVPESKEFPVGARVDPSEFDGWTPEQKEFWLLIRPETSEIDDYEPPTLTGTVNYVIGNMPHIPEAAGGAVHAAASGVAASLPHYWVGELGPEPFFPSVDGRIVSNTQAMSALRGGAGADAAQIADAVKRGVKEAMKEANGGNVYNLTMPTSSNPADVKMAFELMEAWGT